MCPAVLRLNRDDTGRCSTPCLVCGEFCKLSVFHQLEGSSSEGAAWSLWGTCLAASLRIVSPAPWGGASVSNALEGGQEVSFPQRLREWRDPGSASSTQLYLIVKMAADSKSMAVTQKTCFVKAGAAF